MAKKDLKHSLRCLQVLKSGNDYFEPSTLSTLRAIMSSSLVGMTSSFHALSSVEMMPFLPKHALFFSGSS